MKPLSSKIKLDAIEQYDGDFLPVELAAAYIGVTEQSIRTQADYSLPWAYKVGARTVIPKAAFIYFHKYGQRVNMVLKS